MALERTLSIIKPDAVAKNIIGDIYARFEKAGLRIIAAKMQQLSEQQAGEFYAVHIERPFYQELIEFMTSGPVMIQVLEGENAIAKNRELMGATFPKDAAPDTIRADFCDAAHLWWGPSGERFSDNLVDRQDEEGRPRFPGRPDDGCLGRGGGVGFSAVAFDRRGA